MFSEVEVTSQFAEDVLRGFSNQFQKQLAPRYFYDALGSALFEAITLLPEYGLSRADERLLSGHADEIASIVGGLSAVCELGSGSGKKTRSILDALGRRSGRVIYRPIDVSAAALDYCEKELAEVAEVQPVCADWLDGLTTISRSRLRQPLLLLFLGSTIGNLDRTTLPQFLTQIHSALRPGDFFLLGADLVKDVDTMLAAYDDPTGVTSAFNLNILARINRELEADFDLRAFAHEVRWNEDQRRIEMHLLSCRNQSVHIAALNANFEFGAGETIWTESSHKFTAPELDSYAKGSGFKQARTWIDEAWPFAEALWSV